MKICPDCNAENVFDGAQFCKNCGASLPSREADTPSPLHDREQDDSFEFVATETQSPDTPDLFSGPRESKESTNPEDKLEIATAADLVSDQQQQDRSEIDFGKGLESEDISPVAFDEPTQKAIPKETREIPPVDWNKDNSRRSYQLKDIAEKERATFPAEKPGWATNASDSGIFDSPSDTTNDAEPNSIIPAVDPAKLQAPSAKSHKVRGIAYFRGNFIQVAGKPYLHDGDEITINDKRYLLKTKRLGKRVTIGLFAAILVITLIGLASQFVKPTLSGDGTIIGVILNQNKQPYLGGATVALPALGKSNITNSQGFFKFEMIPTGTYEITYRVGDQYIGKGNVTVTAGQTTLMTFSQLEPNTFAEKKNIESSLTAEPESETSSLPEKQQEQPSAPQKSKGGYGQIQLAANVDDARITIDDKVLGAGNNKYGQIRAGKHTIKVDKPGYSEYSRVVEIEPNQTTVIKVDLVRISDSKASKLSADQYISLGYDALASNELSKAIDDFSKAIDLSPASTKAYEGRAKALAMADKAEDAAADYVRAGEIYRVNKDNGKAISAFSSALNHSPKNLSALVGRAGARLDNSDYRPSLIDYETALKADDKFYPALYGSGLCHFKMGDHKNAEKYFKKAYEINKSDPYLYQYLMLTYLARDDIKSLRKIYAEFKVVANPVELAEFKSSSRFEPVLRLINEEDR